MIGPRKIRSKLLAGFIGCLVLTGVATPTAGADLEFTETAVAVRDTSGLYTRQAGAHPDFTFKFSLAVGPPEAVRDVDLDLPVGMIGNPTPFPTCGLSTLAVNECPIESQVGMAEIKLNQKGFLVDVGIYNMPHASDVPALFGFKYTSSIATITPRVRPGDYGISSGSFKITQAEGVEWARVKFWGIPADPVHDTERQGKGFVDITGNPISSTAPKVPFFTNPTACPDSASIFRA